MSELLPIIDVYAPVADALHDAMKLKFEDRRQRVKVVESLTHWLRVKAKKRPVPDIEKRLDIWSERIRLMVENMKIDFSEGKLVIKVTESDESTLKALQFGSGWFEPNNDLMETIWVGLFETSS